MPEQPESQKAADPPMAQHAPSPAAERWYVPSEGDPERFMPQAGGMPPLHLIEYIDAGRIRNLRLCEDSTGLLVSPTDRRLFRAGIYSYNLTGEHHYKAQCRRANLVPGALVHLVREPDNTYDPNAIAVQSGEGETVGYVSKGHAKRLAKLMDSGLALTAISLRGTKAGQACESVAVLAAEPPVLTHLRAPRPPGLPIPAPDR